MVPLGGVGREFTFGKILFVVVEPFIVGTVLTFGKLLFTVGSLIGELPLTETTGDVGIIRVDEDDIIYLIKKQLFLFFYLMCNTK